jgi:hypothetical protein
MFHCFCIFLNRVLLIQLPNRFYKICYFYLSTSFLPMFVFTLWLSFHQSFFSRFPLIKRLNVIYFNE